MLEKKTNDIPISKLHTILLLKVNFNTTRKIIFITRLIPTFEVHYRFVKTIHSLCIFLYYFRVLE